MLLVQRMAGRGHLGEPGLPRLPSRHHRWARRDLPGSWGPLRAFAPLYDPGGTLRQAIWRFGVAAASAYGVGSRVAAFEAQSRSSCSPCPRFAAEVALGPRKTRFRVVASLSRSGFSPAGFLCEVSAHAVMVILLAQALPGAHAVRQGKNREERSNGATEQRSNGATEQRRRIQDGEIS